MAISQSGGGDTTPITGGGAPPAGQQPPPAAGEPGKEQPPAAGEPGKEQPPGGQQQPAPGNNSGVTPGQGKVGPDGSCQCVVQCAPGSFPAMDAQGLGAMGGASGALPVNAVVQ